MAENKVFLLVLVGRQYASRVIAETLLEIETSGTFQSLLQAVEREKEKKNNLHNLIIRLGLRKAPSQRRSLGGRDFCPSGHGLIVEKSMASPCESL